MSNRPAGRNPAGFFSRRTPAMPMILARGKFPPGEIVITCGAEAVLRRDEALTGLLRHMSGDWGELDEDDWRANDAALEHGFRLFSRDLPSNGTTFYVITEYDRSATTILLPSEY